MRDRVVLGIVDWDVPQKLQTEPQLTLEKAVQITHQSAGRKLQDQTMRLVGVKEISYTQQKQDVKHTGKRT